MTRLSFVGFGSSSEMALQLFIGQYRDQYSMVKPEHADVLVIDMEHPAVKPVLEQYRDSRPIIAVTATENTFEPFVTVSKPLEGKLLIKAVKQAVDNFVPGAKSAEDKAQDNAVSNEGEKAFQEYQKRLAAGRQAMADYQNISTDRDEKASEVSKRFSLDGNNEITPATPGDRKPVVSQAKAKPAAKAKPLSEAPAAVKKTEVPPVKKVIPEKKPAEVKAKLSIKTVYECCGNAPDINMHDHEQRRKVFFKEDRTLLAILKEVVAEGKAQGVPVEISGLPGMLAYLPSKNAFMLNFEEDLLTSLALSRFGFQELTLKVRPDLDDEKPSIGVSGIRFDDYESLMWKLALWTAKGRLNSALEPEKPYRLSRELDFDKLLAIPHASTISSLWGRHSLSALEVVKVLKISQRYVFSFMSAAYVLGAFK